MLIYKYFYSIYEVFTYKKNYNINFYYNYYNFKQWQPSINKNKFKFPP